MVDQRRHLVAGQPFAERFEAVGGARLYLMTVPTMTSAGRDVQRCRRPLVPRNISSKAGRSNADGISETFVRSAVGPVRFVRRSTIAAAGENGGKGTRAADVDLKVAVGVGLNRGAAADLER